MRTEHDLLGSRQIPSEVWWGIHTLRALENFPISRKTVGEYPCFVRALVSVKAAAALANVQVKALDEEKAQAIVAACQKVYADESWCSQWPIDLFQGGAGTSVNMNTNEVIANIALTYLGHEKGEYQYLSPFDDVNMSQSTNDSYPTAIRLASSESIQQLRAEVQQLIRVFEHKATEFSGVLKMGRTQLQDAVPMTLGQEMQAFASLLKEEYLHLDTQAALLLEVNMGASAIGTKINVPEGYQEAVISYLREFTGWDIKASSDLVEATSDAGAYVSMHASLKRLAIKLSKICNDLRLLSSGPRAGLGEINLPQMQAGSSIMPAKVNPVIPEVVNQVCFKVRGNDVCVTDAAEAGQLQLNVMEPVIIQCLLESCDLLKAAVICLRERCIQGITANKEVCQSYVENSIGLVTYLNPYIGHVNGDKVGKECARSGKSVREVVLELKLMDEEELDKVLDLNRLFSQETPSSTYVNCPATPHESLPPGC